MGGDGECALALFGYLGIKFLPSPGWMVARQAKGGFMPWNFQLPRISGEAFYGGVGVLLLQCYQNLKAILQTPFKNISFNNSLVFEIKKRIVYFQEMPKQGRGLYPNGLALFLPGNPPIGPLHTAIFLM